MGKVLFYALKTCLKMFWFDKKLSIEYILQNKNISQ